MTPTTIITTIAYQCASMATTAAEISATRPPAQEAHVRNPRTAEVLGWLTRRLDWEERLDRLRDRRTEDRHANVEHD